MKRNKRKKQRNRTRGSQTLIVERLNTLQNHVNTGKWGIFSQLVMLAIITSCMIVLAFQQTNITTPTSVFNEKVADRVDIVPVHDVVLIHLGVDGSTVAYVVSSPDSKNFEIAHTGNFPSSNVKFLERKVLNGFVRFTEMPSS